MLEDVMTNSAISSQTRTVTPVEGPPAVSTTNPELSQLTDQLGSLRTDAEMLHEQATEFHQKIRGAWLNLRSARIRESGPELLEELSDLGFAWRHIAQMVGVSVPAVQKWRRGESMSADNLDKVATLLATCDLIKDLFPIDDIATWFEIRIIPTVPVRPMDLYAAGNIDLLLDWVSMHESDAERVLTLFDPDWRERYRSGYEVFEDEDGELSLRAKDR
jgi:hypothetical protein